MKGLTILRLADIPTPSGIPLSDPHEGGGEKLAQRLQSWDAGRNDCNVGFQPSWRSQLGDVACRRIMYYTAQIDSSIMFPGLTC